MNLELEFCTQYNGVCLHPSSTASDEEHDQFDDVYDKVNDAIEDFPNMTYDMVDKFDHILTDEQEEYLINLAKERVRPILGEVEIEFVYNHVDS